MKIRIERIECYWAKGTGSTRDYKFYVDFPRNATKAEEKSRKEFIKRIKRYDSTEGHGYNWRVDIYTLRSVVEFLPDPKAIKVEMARFDVEGVLAPPKPYNVRCLEIIDSDIPTVIKLYFDDVPEHFRRACDYWRTTHRLTKEEQSRLDLFGGRSMSVTQDMLLAFESWLLFDKPWRDLYTEAIAQRKIWDAKRKAKQYADDAPFREKYPDWDTWTSHAQNKERRKAFLESEVWKEYANRFQREYQRAYSPGFSSTSEITQAFALFELPTSATLEEVKKRYRTLAKRHHPDTLNGNEDAFKKLNDANEVLMKYLTRKS